MDSYIVKIIIRKKYIHQVKREEQQRGVSNKVRNEIFVTVNSKSKHMGE